MFYLFLIVICHSLWNQILDGSFQFLVHGLTYFYLLLKFIILPP